MKRLVRLRDRLRIAVTTTEPRSAAPSSIIGVIVVVIKIAVVIDIVVTFNDDVDALLDFDIF